MNVRNIQRVYLIGIGGIGMSALARFFRETGAIVNGYDRAETDLTKHLVREGIGVQYADDANFADAEAELVIYTPAIPKNNQILKWYNDHNYSLYKRSDVLQWITESEYAITVAGTHGKTTTSTMIAYLLRETGYGCNAFLGGISVNYDRNYWSSKNEVAVIEADEYDRSFLKLSPDIAVLTSMDADHLDIYGTLAELEDAFIKYTRNIKPGGTLLAKYGLKRSNDLHASKCLTYSLDNKAADIHAVDILEKQGGYIFDIRGKHWELKEIYLPIGGMHNVENAVVAIAVTQLLGINMHSVKEALAGFKGIKRRFEYILKNDQVVYIDDYAHHPEELSALIRSAKHLFPARKCVIAFQPHLFSRTRDFAEAFAHSLDMADEVLLLDIYPARELPMEGVTSQLIAGKMNNMHHAVLTKEALLTYVREHEIDLLITAGAGDIDHLIQPIKTILENK